MEWQLLAEYANEVYGAYVDWEERYFICPSCGEPIYEEDYSYFSDSCPVCEELIFE